MSFRSGFLFLQTPLKVLVAEDGKIAAQDLALRLGQLGLEVAGFASTGEEAIERSRELRPGLVLMDAQLPGPLSGMDAGARILDEFDTPVVYLTSLSEEESSGLAERTGFSGYLTRPIQQHALAAGIEMALSRRHAEREVREQRAWLSTVLSTINDGVAITDAQGCVQFLNEMAGKMTGWTGADAQAKPLSSVLAGASPLFQEGLQNALAECFQKGVPRGLPRGFRLRSRGGHSILVEGEVCPSVDKAGTVGSVVIFRDATARDFEEQELRHHQKMQAIGRLAAGVAHDFNNFLMVIMGYASELEQRILDPEGREALAQISRSAQSAAAVTRQLLQFSRKQRGESKDLDLNDLILGVAPLLRRVTGRDVQCVLELDPHPLPLRADPDQLRQILVNLLSNAKDAMPSGGLVTVRTGRVAAEDAPADCNRAGVFLSVRDTGAGMTEEVAARLFEPFFTTKDLGKGTGLGLSIVQGIVQERGGTVSVKSTLGEGSTFWIFLPEEQKAADADRNSYGGQDRVQAASGEEVTLLLAEDDDTVRKVLTGYLAATGHTILTASSGPAALQLAESYPKRIDALLTDIMMPGMNGFQLAKEFARRGFTHKTLYISGYADEILRDLGLPLNSHFLPKPFSRGDLIRELNDILRQPETEEAPAAR